MSRYDRLMSHDFAPVEHRYDHRDTILYALGVGAGPDALDLVYERDLRAIASMATVTAYPGNWYARPEIDLDDRFTVHGSERFELFGDLPVAGHVIATPRIVAIHDKGEGRGALVISQREVRDAATGRHLATVTQRALCRGDGGVGGPGGRPPAPGPLPSRAADIVLHVPTAANAALIYRLLGDDNPLHVDPAFARDAGFDRPILHGLSSYGHLCRAIMEQRPGVSIQAMDCRFTAPVFPGDMIVLEVWDQPGGVAFRAHSRGRVVIDNGEIRFAAEPKDTPEVARDAAGRAEQSTT
ncbi:3-alpha,7-alpha,12-alpha-trihydroxy-5-beta-cholest-24-enoyl-CoA hydratase [Maritimibacter sp. DP07]|jgi:acyl dehydratase|uniref:3-alpha,7-alpha, 12-alpha-trihydroxy-5-beta-cholest-24-enoyl-CoA hydratase n=1 Tax=Maritimibacter harenae TaxID=2606218 RepID=A0A845MC57_9RHOB|nr:MULTISPECIES: MaoC/PaaZ C-terminal domain-containing protein [Maritimibacter]MBL6430130.1 MaoC family dehydratase N-terminal domain-containing protein [Maritimibacter sp.]MZR15391.1 3-alpha,7-alpha,12-alpha-trihydroxy-5-beta-cholest-24-enoyl-CoA hydratase [Maritimibacter harenae]